MIFTCIYSHRHCGITWFWTLAQNVGLRYRALMLKQGDLDADELQVPALWLPMACQA